MAASRTAVWVTSFGGSVDRIAPATNTVSKRYQIGGSPCGIGIDGRGMIWIAVLGTGRVVSLDPTTGKVVHTIPDLGPDLWDLKVRGDDVWVVDRSARQLLRISAATAAVTLRVPIGPSGAGLALVHDRIWVADNVDGKLRSVDPGTGEVLATIEAGGAPTWFVDDGVSTLAIADQASGTVARVDPASGTLGPPVGGWIQPLDGTVIGGDAWVPDGAARVVRVLDLSAGAVTASWTLPDAVRPFVAEPAFGDVWILDAAGTNVWRIRP
jgi:streptogramin lyase